MRHVKLHRPIATAAVAGLLGVAIASAAQAQDRVRWQVPIAFASTLTALGDTLPWVAGRWIVSSFFSWYCSESACPASTCRILPTYRSVRAQISS
jgi:hypothetical protein